MDWIGSLSSVATGGILGFLGTLFGAGFDFLKTRQRNAHEIALLEMHYRQRGQELEQERLIAESEHAANIKVASYSHDTEYGRGSQKITNLLRLVRPGLTIFLVCLTMAVWIWTTDPVTLQEIVDTILFLTGVAVTWWFGDKMQTNQRKPLPWAG